MTPVQARMARAALDLSEQQLSRDTAVRAEDIEALERGAGSPDVAAKLRVTFEGAGIEFIGEDSVRHAGRRDGGTIPLEALNSENDE